MVIKFSEEQRLNAVKLYQEGNSVSEVEQLTGISSNYTKDLLKKYGVQARPSGFQKRNLIRKDKIHSSESKLKISEAHKLSGHKPTLEAAAKGRPLTLKSRWKDHVKDPVAYMIRSYKQGATRRKLDFLLTREEFESFIYSKCYYCGAEPTLRSVSRYCSLVCNGIDREDNSCGYYKSNCVPACKMCNVMKSSMGHQEFIQHCQRIAKRFVDAN
jgi:transposase-like protein